MAQNCKDASATSSATKIQSNLQMKYPQSYLVGASNFIKSKGVS